MSGRKVRFRQLRNTLIIRAACVLATSGICHSTAAATIVIPSNYATTEGNAMDNAPLGATEQHFQQVYSATLLAALNIGDQINGIGFRVQSGESGLPAQTVSTYNVSLSMAALPAGSMSSTFADNRGSDFQTVRSGPLAIAAGDFPGGSSPNAFGWIQFSTPYVYKGGNLLIEIAYQGFASGRDTSAVWPYTPGLAQTAFGTGYNATTADAGIYNEAIITALSTVDPVGPTTAVPEPGAASLLPLSALLFAIRRLRRSCKIQ